ncbi:Coiled-coil domain-containing protein 117 [Acipenser ruthenus]|uniref:Coiled-coil domain-containing protein 117 n=1 Tax=Acipenser ruthenus TaxID=7906 RepID=A0A444V1K3_ACIRT|nr:coiled-coil domain-containing protein 117-like isoform X3 [Acipenser ruthenus]RXM94262.1 Coiled-coil domain-containing protein 117 [Acipenser ruthenus]
MSGVSSICEDENTKTQALNRLKPGEENVPRSCERRYERKHKREHDEETAIPRKRQATAEMVSPSYQAPSFLPEGVAPQHCWGDLSASPQEPAELEGQAAHMEVEGRESVKQWGAAHRRLQEIEDSIIVEDDDEDLETESTNSSFPVLVMSDTLREGLKQGLGDVIPRKIAQSLNHSCMEMVIWRPPEDVLCSKQRETMERLRHSTDSSPVAGAPVLKDRDSELQQHPAQTPVYRDLSHHSCTEEDMEL